MRLVSPPLYEITTQTTSKSIGIKVITECLALVEKNAKRDKNFIFKIIMEPKSTGA